MTENNHLTFAAIIRITLPDAPDVVTANVTLTAADAIPLEDGRFKPLYACTLADLQDFADALEADVWQTYQRIKLIDLAEDESVDVELTITDASGTPVSPSRDWFKKAMVVPNAIMAADDETAVTDEETPFVADMSDDELLDEPLVDETAVVSEVPESIEEAEPEVMETDQKTASDAAAEPTAERAEPESDSAYAEPEIEAEPAEEVEEDTTPIITRIKVAEPEPVFEELEADLHDPWIAPSQARVRVAGRRLSVGHPTWAAVDILLDESALRSAQAHALSSMDREVAGVMIGPRPEKQPDGRYVVHVIDTIIAKHTVMQGASVTYTPESWRYMNDKLMERYPDETAVIVGWYHTHPGFGIFLSGMDQFIHQNFFTQIWHIAYVLDPRARTSGFFSWDRQKTRVSPFEFQWPSWAARSW
ncbi:MAG: Mov34/MPN/PAD-1 family protein [Anaerolineales bacterium]|nr:Mov34/MPN/PAD-1 family protein [Anaerolineales bacterium]